MHKNECGGTNFTTKLCRFKPANETGRILVLFAALFQAKFLNFDENCKIADYSVCSLRAFLRFRLRAKAAFTRFFSPGFK